ncbi:hypothetical protein PAHAL_9G488100 [Panicum hallii]|uniref:Uncharacterized protein n=1 Tax=Panicum hallii TaxID=206008 RepID=A0A2T8I548_9POAL|nr:hypothetical protein PAHAL_9G488100 [Panicum hallii]
MNFGFKHTSLFRHFGRSSAGPRRAPHVAAEESRDKRPLHVRLVAPSRSTFLPKITGQTTSCSTAAMPKLPASSGLAPNRNAQEPWSQASLYRSPEAANTAVGRVFVSGNGK